MVSLDAPPPDRRCTVCGNLPEAASPSPLGWVAWCWSPEVGFHLFGESGRPLAVVATGTAEARPSQLLPSQAFELGLWYGPPHDDRPTSEFLGAVVQFLDQWRGDLYLVALFGYEAQGLAGLDHAPEARRVVLGEATRFVVSTVDVGGWREPLLAASTAACDTLRPGRDRDATPVGTEPPALPSAAGDTPLSLTARALFAHLCAAEVGPRALCRAAHLLVLAGASTAVIGTWLLYTARVARLQLDAVGARS